jgi:hypothetical protein
MMYLYSMKHQFGFFDKIHLVYGRLEKVIFRGSLKECRAVRLEQSKGEQNLFNALRPGVRRQRAPLGNSTTPMVLRIILASSKGDIFFI